MLAAAALNRYSSPDETPQDVHWMNAAAAALVVVAVLMLLAVGLLKLGRLPYFDLQRVQIEGDLSRNNLATVRANTVPRLYGSFFQADLARSRAVFESVPWVRKAVVRRVWPNQLRVTLEEHQPAAFWRQAHSEDQLVNTFGEVFDANLGDVEDERLPTLGWAATHPTLQVHSAQHGQRWPQDPRVWHEHRQQQTAQQQGGAPAARPGQGGSLGGHAHRAIPTLKCSRQDATRLP